MRVVELQPVQVKLDRTPGVRRHQLGEVVRQLLFAQMIDWVIKARTDAADRAGVRLNCLRPQAFELQVLPMRLVVLPEMCIDRCFHLGVTSWLVVEQPLGRGDEVTY